MFRNIVIYAVILVVLTSGVIAAEVGVTSGQDTSLKVSDAANEKNNKFLSAETQRIINEKTDEMLQEMKKYDDENFKIFDGRMQALVNDVKLKFVIGGLGAVFLAMGLVGYLMNKNVRKYSYETYLEELLKKQDELLQTQGMSQQQQQQQQQQQSEQLGNSGMQQMQQAEWYPHESANTIGMDMGQGWASEQTQMNNWQAQPVYDGAWKSPVETVPYYKEQWMREKGYRMPDQASGQYVGQQDEQYQDQYSDEDPMNVGQNVRGTY